MTKASKHFATLSLRRAAKANVLNAVSKRLIVRSTLRLIRSSDLLATFRPDHSSSGTPANGRVNPRSNNSRSNGYDHPYSIFVSCNKCGRIHDTGISLVMQHGPVHKKSLADLYKRKVPKRVKKLSRTIVTCPWTGKRSLQTDNGRIFLVPTNSR